MKRLEPQRRLGRVAAVVATVLCVGICQADDESDEQTEAEQPWHPYLEPAPWLTETDAGGVDEDLLLEGTFRIARILFPEFAEGAMPTIDFGAIAWGWGGHVVLFLESEGGTLVEKREIDRDGVSWDDLAYHETPGIVTGSRPLQPEIATAAISAIRRALANARPHRPGNRFVLDGVQHYFFSGDRAGRAHSPDTDTEAGQIARLARVLGEFVDGWVEEREVRVAAEDALRANHGLVKDR